jgi:hypothetical protein
VADELLALRQSLASRYRLDREIGRGGTSVVYAAWDLAHSRDVAIKVLRNEIPEVLGTDRFRREIRISSGLDHPGIMPLLDSGEVDGRFYLVMPLIGGENLRDRLQREKQLPLDEALRITRDVADALAVAHRHGVVHRDIKPPNIMLDGSRTVVTDFGLARALPASVFAGESSLSTPGVVIGTVLYMAPEQAAGQEVDARADIYSLGCVLYEMLVGEAPFPGTDMTAILARHMSQPPASVRIIRRGVPEHVDLAIMRALEKSPADRFASVAEFSAALSHPGILRYRPSRTVVRSAAAAVVVAGVLATAYSWRDGNTRDSSDGVRPDTTVYAVLPVVRAAGVPEIVNEDQIVTDALERWSGIRLVERFQLEDALSRQPGGELTPERAASVSRSVGAGRFIRIEIGRASDSLRLRGVHYDAAGSGAVVRQFTVRAEASPSGLGAAITRLADELLFPGGAGTAPLEAGTRSLPARQAFARGEAAFGRWDFDEAISAFASALSYDSYYSRANLRLALVSAWSRRPKEEWRVAAQRAAREQDRLQTEERSLVLPLVAQARGDLETACRRWREITVADSLRFTGWYGLALCLVDDQAVLRSTTSPSGWRFRTSYRDAVGAYRRAFEMSPTVLSSLRSEGTSAVRDLLFARGDHRRRGRVAAPDTGTFLARPSWDGDTLAFVPYRARDVHDAKPGTTPPTMHVAIANQRDVFLDMASTWLRATGSVEALEAVAVALQLIGQRAAVDSFHRARQLAQRPEDRTRIGIEEAWYRLQLSVPNSEKGIRVAKALADSLLRLTTGQRERHLRGLAGLASLTGRGHLAAQLLREAAAAGQNVAGQGALPRAIADQATALLAYSSMGGPPDSLARLSADLDIAISMSIPSEKQEETRVAWRARSAVLAIPSDPATATGELTAFGYPLLDAMIAQVHRPGGETSQLFDGLREVRRGLAPEGLTIDVLLPEAWLMGETGTPSQAAAWLDPWLASLHKVGPWELGNVPFAGAFVRAMMLRARLAAESGDSAGAARWAKVVSILWSDADPYLQDAVRDMRNLTRREGK